MFFIHPYHSVKCLALLFCIFHQTPLPPLPTLYQEWCYKRPPAEFLGGSGGWGPGHKAAQSARPPQGQGFQAIFGLDPRRKALQYYIKNGVGNAAFVQRRRFQHHYLRWFFQSAQLRTKAALIFPGIFWEAFALFLACIAYYCTPSTRYGKRGMAWKPSSWGDLEAGDRFAKRPRWAP